MYRCLNGETQSGLDLTNNSASEFVDTTCSGWGKDVTRANRAKAILSSKYQASLQQETRADSLTFRA